MKIRPKTLKEMREASALSLRELEALTGVPYSEIHRAERGMKLSPEREAKLVEVLTREIKRAAKRTAKLAALVG